MNVNEARLVWVSLRDPTSPLSRCTNDEYFFPLPMFLAQGIPDSIKFVCKCFRTMINNVMYYQKGHVDNIYYEALKF